MDYLLGIDIGSTSLKAIVYDLDGNAVARGSRPTERFHPNPDHPEWTVWQPEQIWQGIAAAIQEALAPLGDVRDIKAAAVTGMGMDGVPVDEKGRWLYPFISWHDTRTTDQLQWWKKNITAERVFSIGGNPLWYMNSALRILWMAEHEPKLMARTAKWLLIEDFVNFQLCGRQATDYSMASCTLLFDQRSRQWSQEMLQASGIDRRLMPEVFPSGTPLGEVSAEAAQATGLAEGTPVILGGHDHLCGALPVGAFRPGTVLDVTGTWETVLTAVPQPVLTEKIRQAGLTVQSHVAPGMYAVWGGSVAGQALEWFRAKCGHEAKQIARERGAVDWDVLMAAAAECPPGSRGVMFLPHMSAASCPVVDERALGAFVGMSDRATTYDLLRAMIEGLDYQFLDILSTVEEGLGMSQCRIVAVGGSVRNEFWMQNKADVIGRPIDVPAVEEATPLGAAILAGIGVGLYRDVEDAFGRVFRPGKTYQPDEKLSAQYADWFNIYRQLYPALRSISHQLHERFQS